MTSVALTVISDGRVDYLHETIASLEENCVWPFVRKVIVDDSGLFLVRLRLEQEFPDYEVISHKKRSGIAAAVQTGWGAALETDCEYVWHQEQDFTFNEPVDIPHLVDLLEEHSHLAHIVLKRGPYSPEEIEAGDFMAVHSELYQDMMTLRCGGGRDASFEFVEWDALFSLNPSLIRRKAIELAPFTTESEFAKALLTAGYRFAFLGRTSDPPLVTHIGEHRALGWKP